VFIGFMFYCWLGRPGTELRQRQTATANMSGASPSAQPTVRPASVPPHSTPNSPTVQPNKESSQSLLSPSASSEGMIIPPG